MEDSELLDLCPGFISPFKATTLPPSATPTSSAPVDYVPHFTLDMNDSAGVQCSWDPVPLDPPAALHQSSPGDLPSPRSAKAQKSLSTSPPRLGFFKKSLSMSPPRRGNPLSPRDGPHPSPASPPLAQRPKKGSSRAWAEFSQKLGSSAGRRGGSSPHLSSSDDGHGGGAGSKTQVRRQLALLCAQPLPYFLILLLQLPNRQPLVHDVLDYLLHSQQLFKFYRLCLDCEQNQSRTVLLRETSPAAKIIQALLVQICKKKLAQKLFRSPAWKALLALPLGADPTEALFGMLEHVFHLEPQLFDLPVILSLIAAEWASQLAFLSSVSGSASNLESTPKLSPKPIQALLGLDTSSTNMPVPTSSSSSSSPYTSSSVFTSPSSTSSSTSSFSSSPSLSLAPSTVSSTSLGMDFSPSERANILQFGPMTFCTIFFLRGLVPLICEQVLPSDTRYNILFARMLQSVANGTEAKDPSLSRLVAHFKPIYLDFCASLFNRAMNQWDKMFDWYNPKSSQISRALGRIIDHLDFESGELLELIHGRKCWKSFKFPPNPEQIHEIVSFLKEIGDPSVSYTASFHVPTKPEDSISQEREQDIVSPI